MNFVRRCLAAAQTLVTVIVLGFGLCCAPSLYAIPQFSLLSGNKCLNCHVNTQGSGIRNELGWYVAKDMKLIDPQNVGLGWLYDLDAESNSFLDGTLTIGLDVRIQSARSPRSDNAVQRVFPMQAALHIAYQPVQWLTIESMTDIAALVRDLSNRPQAYIGQRSWNASVIIQPGITAPQLRVGHFQPSIGVRYDDHTKLARQIAGANGSTLIPPNYAEYGAELNYEGIQWLSLTVGAFLPGALSQMLTTNRRGEVVRLLENIPANPSVANLVNSPSFLGRAMLWLRTDDHTINSYAGASVYSNSVFSLANVFAGIGLTDRLSLMGEYALSGVQDGRQTRNLSLELSYQPVVGLMPYVRYERGTTRQAAVDAPSGIGEYFSQQVSVGAQIFPIPYVEIRPELRYFETEGYRALRWAAQLHIFY
jgi:hypothetical protein